MGSWQPGGQPRAADQKQSRMVRRQVLKPAPEGGHSAGRVRTRWGAPEAGALSGLSPWRGKSTGGRLSGESTCCLGMGLRCKTPSSGSSCSGLWPPGVQPGEPAASSISGPRGVGSHEQWHRGWDDVGGPGEPWPCAAGRRFSDCPASPGRGASGAAFKMQISCPHSRPTDSKLWWGARIGPSSAPGGSCVCECCEPVRSCTCYLQLERGSVYRLLESWFPIRFNSTHRAI